MIRPCGPDPARACVAQRLARISAGMAADAPGGDWPGALACMRVARDRVQACMAGSTCDAARAYSTAVGEWVGGLPEEGGRKGALQQPASVRYASTALPAQPPALRQARVAFTEAVRRARALASSTARRQPVSKACCARDRRRLRGSPCALLRLAG